MCVRILLAILILFQVYAADAAEDPPKFGKAAGGLAARIVSLTKDPLTPFAFEVIVRNESKAVVEAMGLQNLVTWRLLLTSKDSGKTHLVISGPGSGVLSHVPVRPGGEIRFKFASSFLRLRSLPIDLSKVPPGEDWTTGVVEAAGAKSSWLPITALPPGEYDAALGYSFKKASINGRKNAFTETLISGSVPIRFDLPQDRPASPLGSGMLVGGVIPRLEGKFSTSERPFSYQLSLQNSHSDVARFASLQPWLWTFRFKPLEGSGKVVDVTASSSPEPGEKDLVVLKGGKAHTLSVQLQDNVKVGAAEFRWEFEQDGNRLPISKLPAGRYSVTAGLLMRSSGDDAKKPERRFFFFEHGDLWTNSIEIEIKHP